MKIYEICDRTPKIIEELLSLWEDSVRATHKFLSSESVDEIKKYVPDALSGVRHLIIAENESNEPLGFMGVENSRLEMLFVSPNEIGKGIGRRLVEFGIKNYKIHDVTVNEQNPKAVGFYEHLGFKTYKRTDLDEQGNQYPILYMKLM